MWFEFGHQISVNLHQRLFGLLIFIQHQFCGDGTRDLWRLLHYNSLKTSMCDFILNNIDLNKPLMSLSVFTSRSFSLNVSLSAMRLLLSSSSFRASLVSVRSLSSLMILRIFLRPLGVPFSSSSPSSSPSPLCTTENQKKYPHILFSIEITGRVGGFGEVSINKLAIYKYILTTWSLCDESLSNSAIWIIWNRN